MSNLKRKYIIFIILSVIFAVAVLTSGQNEDSPFFLKNFFKESEKNKVINKVINYATEADSSEGSDNPLAQKKDNRSPEEIADEMALEADSELIPSDTYKFSDKIVPSSKSEDKKNLKEDNINASSQALEDTRDAIAVSNMLDAFLEKDLSEGGKKDIEDKDNQEEPSFFTAQDISEFNALSDKSDGLVPGRNSRSKNVNSNVSIELTPTPTNTPEEEDEDEYVVPKFTGQARGYAMLYLMHPKARHTAATELQTLLHSGIKEVYLSVLTDGTFGKDFDYLKNVLQIFHEKNRVTTLALYLTNGSSMRKYNTTTIEAGFNKIAPEEFRTLIRYDLTTRNKFAEMVREVKPVFDYNRSLSINNKNIAIVMLEDNLDADSYVAMRNIASSILGDSVKFVRNPCPNCYPGNDAEPVGDPLEFHSPNNIPELRTNDGFTLDGVGFHFPWESGSGLSIDDVKALQSQCYGKGAGYFAIWRFQRQGIYKQGEVIHPDDRNYEIPTAEQVEVEKSIFSDGLERISE